MMRMIGSLLVPSGSNLIKHYDNCVWSIAQLVQIFQIFGEKGRYIEKGFRKLIKLIEKKIYPKKFKIGNAVLIF